MGVKRSFFILKVVACMLAIAQASNFISTGISDQSSLFYESVGKVQFTSNDWRLMSVINITRLKTQQPSLSKDVLTHVNNTCKELASAEVCKRVLMTNNLLQKSQQIEKDLEKVHETINELSVGVTNGRFGFLGILNKTLINVTSVHHNDGISNFKSLENAHYIHDRINDLKIQSELSLQMLNSTFDAFKKGETTSDDVLSDIRTWVRYFEFELDSYIWFLKTVTEALPLCETGMVHPNLITTSMIKRGMEKYLRKNIHNNLVFPTHADDERIWNISKTDVGYYNGTLIMVIDIPLVDATVYDLSQMQSYPVAQEFGHTRGSAYIQPRADYLLSSQNYYTFAYNEELSKCMKINDTYLCRYVRPIYDVKLYPSCESKIIMSETQNQLEIFDNCNIQISSTFKPQWTQINNGWLYSLPEIEKLNIVCQGNWKQAIEISGVGVLQMKKECYALTASNLMIKGIQGSFQNVEEHASSIRLNATALLSTLKYVNFIPQQYTPLSVYQQKIKENLYHDYEEDLQKSVIGLLIIILIVVVFFLLFLPCIIRAKRTDVRLLTVRQRQL